MHKLEIRSPNRAMRFIDGMFWDIELISMSRRMIKSELAQLAMFPFERVKSVREPRSILVKRTCPSNFGKTLQLEFPLVVGFIMTNFDSIMTRKTGISTEIMATFSFFANKKSLL